MTATQVQVHEPAVRDHAAAPPVEERATLRTSGEGLTGSRWTSATPPRPHSNRTVIAQVAGLLVVAFGCGLADTYGSWWWAALAVAVMADLGAMALLVPPQPRPRRWLSIPHRGRSVRHDVARRP